MNKNISYSNYGVSMTHTKLVADPEILGAFEFNNSKPMQLMATTFGGFISDPTANDTQRIPNIRLQIISINNTSIFDTPESFSVITSAPVLNDENFIINWGPGSPQRVKWGERGIPILPPSRYRFIAAIMDGVVGEFVSLNLLFEYINKSEGLVNFNLDL